MLEAFDIFFNDRDATVKLEKEDLNKEAEHNGEGEILIGVVFSNFPEQIIIDSNVSTSLREEFLLNEDNLLEIHKIYKNGKLIKTYLVCKHPVNEKLKDLLLLKIQELKKRAKELNIDLSNVNKTISSEIRKAIRENFPEDIRLSEQEIPLDKEDAKKIWIKLQSYLPLYTLFKSDRQNTDKDDEIQDPLKLTIQEVLQSEEVHEKLQEITDKVNEAIKQTTESTLNKLKEMNPEVASDLKANVPEYNKLKWQKAFEGIQIVSDDNIPLNKRGSGVKRLLLLNFFRAQAEKRLIERGLPSIIYAIEEPETSQHPQHQKLLINALVELSQADNTQIILTTHSPAIAQLLPIDSLRLITVENGQRVVKKGENILREIARELGIMPSYSKVVVCVEGENDRKFLLNINRNIPEIKNIIDLERENISIIPMKGSMLINWIERNYLKDSNMFEFHLYDNDREDYRRRIREINEANDGRRFGKLTRLREFENYIHWSLIEDFDGFDNISCDEIKDNWANADIPLFIKNNVNKYMNLQGEAHKKAISEIKQILNGSLSKRMSKELFEELGVWDEVKGWFEEIKQLLDRTVTVFREHS